MKGVRDAISLKPVFSFTILRANAKEHRIQLYNIFLATLVLGFKFNKSTQPQYDSDGEATHGFSPPSLTLRP